LNLTAVKNLIEYKGKNEYTLDEPALKSVGKEELISKILDMLKLSSILVFLNPRI